MGDNTLFVIPSLTVEKCFDALWAQECINDIFDAGLQNDNLPLLFLANQNGNCSIKVNAGKSERIDIQNIIMQGTVWGSLYCTTSMDKLAKKMYMNKELLYKYKGEVETPCLGMVDDILSVQKCSTQSVRNNAVINAFIELKKLKFSKSKCHRIHVSKASKNKSRCPELKVHDDTMENSSKEKYLGDFISSNSTTKATINERKAKGYAIVAEIMAILKDIPLGEHMMEIGLQLRQAMFLNGILFNSEAWHNVSENDIKVLETIDEHLLRSLVQGHSKAPLEFQYLEAGALPIRHIISCRRLLFLQTILNRQDSELTKRILTAQANNPSPGDFVNHIDEDLKKIEEKLVFEDIENMSVGAFKILVKKNIKKAAFEQLKKVKSNTLQN